MNASQIQENIYEAIRTIIQSELSTISYDTTLICTIIDDSKREDGSYTVTDGSVRFDALSENTSYRNNDQVLVSIQQGDYTKEKTIIRKYIADNKPSSIIYVKPLDSMLDMTGNLIEEGDASLLANGSIPSKLVATYECDIKNGMYDTLGVKASFKSLLDDATIREGHYGLRLVIKDKTGEHNVEFDCRTDMLGNPYAYTTYFSQQKKIDISEFEDISKIEIYFYQKNDFKYVDPIDGNLLLYPITFTIGGEEILKQDNLFVSDIELTLGQDLKFISDNTLKIYTNDSSTYLGPQSKTLNFLWCNKDENNQYIGFSDGVWKKDYDEEAYAKENSARLEGIGQQALVTTEKIPPITEGYQIYLTSKKEDTCYSNIETHLNRNGLVSIIQNLYNQLNACGVSDTIINEYFKGVIQREDNSFKDDESYTEALNSLTPKLEESYKAYLEDYYDIYNDPPEEEITQYPSYNFSSDAYDIAYEKVQYYIGGCVIAYDNLLEFLPETYPTTKVYIINSQNDLFEEIKKINEEFIELKNYINEQENQCKQLEDKFINKDLTSIGDEYNNFLADNANHYCIYWYKKDEESNGDRFLGNGWKKVYSVDFNDLVENPDEINPPYKLKFEDTSYITEPLNEKRQTEIFQAVLFFNHEMYKSQTLEFTNEKIVVDEYLLDNAKALSIEHGIDSYASYQLYGSNNYLVNNGDKYINRQLRVRYKGASETDKALNGSTIYWYVPNQATMITYNERDLLQKGFGKLTDSYIGDNETLKSYKKPGYDIFFKTINDIGDKIEESVDTLFYYRISDYYVPTAGLNKIACKVVKGDKTFDAEMPLTFSTFGTSGTDFTLMLAPANFQSSVVFYETDSGFNSLPMLMKSQIYDFNNKIINQEAQTIQWIWNKSIENKIGYISGTGKFIFYVPDVGGPDGYRQVTLESIDDVEDNGPSFFQAIGYADKKNVYRWVPIDDIKRLFDGTHEYREVDLELSSKAEDLSDIGYQVLSTTLQSENITDTLKSNQTLLLQSYYPIPVSLGEYYIEGASTVVYNALGTSPTYYNNPYRIFNANTNEEIEGVEWRIIPYEKISEEISNNESDNIIVRKCYTYNNRYYGQARGYLENQTYYKKNEDNSFEIVPVNSEEEYEDSYYIDFTIFAPAIKKKEYDTNSSLVKDGYYLVPLAMYITDNDYYFSAGCYEKYIDENGKEQERLIYVQPLMISQNRYSSPMINQWDENLTIDEENGIILSTMLGAGYKDEKNQFFGVLIGDVQEAFDDNSPVIHTGVYGFHEGVLSFGLRDDGTMFLGKSGCGQLLLDGNKAIIKSANYDILNKGMLIDFDDGFIDIKNNQTAIRIDITSPYFQIKSSDDNNLIYIADDGYLLQSNNFNINDETGFQLNLQEGNIIGYKFLLEAGIGNNKIIINSTYSEDNSTYPLKIGENFSVQWNGNIKSTGGTIGGWIISSNQISSNDGNTYIKSNGTRAFQAGGGAFYVNHNGYLYASNAYISGSISSSIITGSAISGGSVTAESLTLSGKSVSINSVTILTDVSIAISKSPINYIDHDGVQKTANIVTEVYIGEYTQSMKVLNAGSISGGSYEVANRWG